MRRPTFSPQSKGDLNDIGCYIAKDNPRRAVSFIQELRAQCRKIAQAPKAYRPRPELGQGMRSCAEAPEAPKGSGLALTHQWLANWLYGATVENRAFRWSLSRHQSW